MSSPNKKYPRDFDHWSHTMLEVYRESPAKAAAIYVHRTMAPDPPTLNMILGSLTHALLFEPETFDDHYVLCDAKKRAGQKWTKCCEEAALGDCEPAMEYQAALANNISNVILSHPVAAKLLKSAPGIVEKPIRWRESSTGLPCKCKPDWLIQHICMDLKTTSDPRPEAFLKTVLNYGYHRQAALYLEGIATTLGFLDTEWVIIAAGNKEPHDIWIYRLDQEFIEQGVAENYETLAGLTYSIARNDWTGTGQNDLITLSRPKWARSEK